MASAMKVVSGPIGALSFLKDRQDRKVAKGKRQGAAEEAEKYKEDRKRYTSTRSELDNMKVRRSLLDR